VIQGCKSHAPWLFGGGIATRQGQGGQAAAPDKIGARHLQDLSAPDGAIGAKTGAVKDNGQHLVPQAMFGHHRHGVGMVVLNQKPRQARFLFKLLPIPVAQIIRMKVADHELWPGIQKILQMIDAFFEKIQ